MRYWRKGLESYADYRCTRAQSSKRRKIKGSSINYNGRRIKVIEGEKGLFIAMPSKRALDGEYRDIAHPINSGTRDRIQKIILDKYAEVLEETDDAETAEI